MRGDEVLLEESEEGGGEMDEIGTLVSIFEEVGSEEGLLEQPARTRSFYGNESQDLGLKSSLSIRTFG